MSKSFRIPFLTLLFAFNVEAFAQQDKAKLNLGAVLPLSGNLSLFGLDLQQGMQLALTTIKEEDPELGNRIIFHFKDYESVATKAPKVAKELIDSRLADALIGPITGSTTLAVFRELGESNRPLISATAGDTQITKLNDNVFRSCLVDPYQGKILANFASSELKKNRAAIIVEENSDYAKTIADSFEQELTGLGGKTLVRQTYKPGTLDFTKQLTQIKRNNPQVILHAGYYKEAALLTEQAKRMGINAVFLGSDGWDSPKLFSEANRESIRGHYYLAHFSAQDPDPAVRAFVQSFVKEYKHEPSMYAALGYDVVMLIADAFKRAKTNLPNQLNRALTSAQSVRSVMGPLAMTPSRDALKSAVILSTSAEGSRFKTRLGLANASASQNQPQRAVKQ